MASGYYQKAMFRYAVFVLILFELFQFTFGKYNMTLLDIQKCKHPLPPYGYLATEIVNYEVGLYKVKNKPYIEGNTTLKQDVAGKYFWRFQSGLVIENRPIKYHFNWPAMTCKDMMIRFVLLYTNIKYVPKSCIYKKGVYKFHALDLNKIDGLVTYIPLRDVGLNRYMLSLHSENETIVCLDLLLLIKNVST